MENLLTGALTNLEARVPFSAADREAFLSLPVQPRAFRPGHHVVREAERPAHCQVLLSGFAYRSKVVGGGARQILGLHFPGEFVDIQNVMLGIADHSVQALTAIEVAAIPIPSLLSLMERNVRINRALWTHSLIDAAITREWLANVGRRDARSRVSHLLCELIVRQEQVIPEERPSYHLPMSQEHLADALALTSVHVNRTLMTLEADGLIRRNKRQVEVIDWPGLRKLGDFDPTYLHLPRAQSALRAA